MTAECRHNWHFVPDWYGDPTVPNGTADCSRWECDLCGAVERDPPDKPERHSEYEKS